MKKRKAFPAMLLALSLLVGCAGQGTGVGSGDVLGAVSEQETTSVETLRMEFAPVGGDTVLLMESLHRLRGKLQAALKDAGVELSTVQLSVGTSISATGQALAHSSVDAAFFPAAEDLVNFGGEAQVILTRAYPEISCSSSDPADWNGSENVLFYTGEAVPGWNQLLCAGPSAYGRALAGRVRQGKQLSWTELQHARWGLAEGDAGGQLSLWLADYYEGNTLSDLKNVVSCAGYEQALRALAEEEVDIILLAADQRIDYAAQWQLEAVRTAENGGSGFGRPASIWEEVCVVGLTEPFYGVTAAVSSESPWLKEPMRRALCTAVQSLSGDEDLMALSGAGSFLPLEDGALDSVRRLATLSD